MSKEDKWRPSKEDEIEMDDYQRLLRELEIEAPSPALIAQLAATLAAGRETVEIGRNVRALTETAMELYKSAVITQQNHLSMAATIATSQAKRRRLENAVPKPRKGYPASLKEFMQRVIAKGDETKNLPTLKSFLRSVVWHTSSVEQNRRLTETQMPTDDDITRIVERYRKTGLDETAWLEMGKAYDRFKQANRVHHARHAASRPRPNRRASKKSLEAGNANEKQAGAIEAAQVQKSKA